MDPRRLPRDSGRSRDPDGADTQALLAALRTRYLPRTVVALRPPGPAGEAAASVVPLLAERDLVGGAAAAYVCQRFTCRRPVTDPEALLAELGR